MYPISVGVTTFQEKTWGRVYVQYEKNGVLLFAFKNWIKSDEKTYYGTGKLDDEPAYNWFSLENRTVFNRFQEVLNGAADHLFLTPLNYKEKYGTPSVILERLLIEIRANDYQKVENRRGWYNRSKLEEISMSPIIVEVKNRTILFTEYQTEIRLQPKQFLIYLFYLKHPEGLFRNQIPDFEKEIKELYEKVTRSTDHDKIRQTVTDLVLLNGNSWDEQISKIKKSFTDNLGNRIAEKYIIQGKRNEKYFISIDQNLLKIN